MKDDISFLLLLSKQPRQVPVLQQTSVCVCRVSVLVVDCGRKMYLHYPKGFEMLDGGGGGKR